MKRFLMMHVFAFVLCAIATFQSAYAEGMDGKLTPPKNRPIKVAFVLNEGAVVIDFGGPWEVFSNVMLPGDFKNMQDSMPFDLYTVGTSTKPIHTSGTHSPGMQITPDYDFSNVPEPDLVVVPADKGSPALTAWLKKINADHKIIMSVCTGAFNLAETGLLDGKVATTHHDALDEFAKHYPNIKVVRGARYVQSSPTLFTSGGLSAGIDLALHIVEEYYGRDVAQATADNLEYQGTGWKMPPLQK
ncbi:MAG: DJ-1/PfpI family protein [Burkholderiales bacterium]|nr:DJ-1/PfpI family protein [Burkholderiales bacterium]